MAKTAAAPEMLLPPATLSFPHLFTPRKVSEKDDPKFSMVAIWGPADVPKLQDVKQVCARLLAGKYGDTWLEMVKAGQIKWPFKKITGLLVKPGYPEGGEMVNFNVAADQRPPCYDRYQDPATGKARVLTDPAKFYSGALVVVLARPFLYDKAVNKGVTLGLQGVQFWADGPRMDGRKDPIEQFEATPAPTASMPATDGDPLTAMLANAGSVALP